MSFVFLALFATNALAQSTRAPRPPVRTERAAPAAASVATVAGEVIPRDPSPLEDDAGLHDIQFVSSRLGWAVGDHGVIWHTRDGGEQWELQTSGVTCTLSSVCFLSDQVGWAAGGETVPFTRLSTGVLLSTTNGGRTWKLIAGPSDPATLPKVEKKSEKGADRKPGRGRPPSAEEKPSEATETARPFLPRLNRIKFFSTDEGFAVGQGTPDQPSGVFVTEDGGRLWRSVPGTASAGWLAADFSSSETGALAGPRGRVALTDGHQLFLPRVGNLGQGTLYDIAFSGALTGWLVGDGGRALRTKNGGLVWEAPPNPLAEGIRDAFDFRAVACRDGHVWIAGTPGSIVWHSADEGKTWESQRTGQTAPITALNFFTSEQGWAAGAFGMLLRTVDGGKTWEAVRGGKRRLAILFLGGDRDRLSFRPIVELSGESGYRSLIAVMANEDASATRPGDPNFAARLAEATTRAGGSGAQVEWRLALDLPGIERNAERLVAEWNRRTEGKLEQVLVGGLVRQFRTWRPNVLVLEQAGEADALTRLVNEAALKARDLAEDGTQFPEHRELAALAPWTIDKVYLHLPQGSTGHVQIDPHRYLPHLREPLHDVASRAESLLFDETAGAATSEAYRLVRSRFDEQQTATIAGGFFGGLSIAPGSDARRNLAPIDDGDLEARQKLANRQRVFSAYTAKALDDSQKAGALIAELPRIVREMSAPQGALQLAELAERYHEHGQWDLAELTMIELVDRYPGEPAAHRAMQQLIQYWSSAEVTWRRLRPSLTRQQREESDPTNTARAIAQVEERLQVLARDAYKDMNPPNIFEEKEEDERPRPRGAIVPASAAFVKSGYSYHKELEQRIRYWQAQGAQMLKILERRAPQLATSPELRFPMAALYRQRGLFTKSDEIYRGFLQRPTIDFWTRAAEAEMWLVQPVAPLESAVDCLHTDRRPLIDGRLADDCWRNAPEMVLGIAERDAASDERPRAMLCYDDRYLYVAATLPRAAGVRTDGPSREPRRYDDDLDDFDRLTLFLDVDRDRVTYFSFTIDQRGCTSEACWQDKSWNPRGWFVAVDADGKNWRLEAAIPFGEIVPQAPQRGTAWGVGLVRTTPAVGRQSWTQPAGEHPRPETFGLVRFD